MHLYLVSWNKRGRVRKTRIRFNSNEFATLAIVIFRAPYTHEHDTWFYRELL